MYERLGAIEEQLRKEAEAHRRKCKEMIRAFETIIRCENLKPDKTPGIIEHCNGKISYQRIHAALVDMDLALMDCGFDANVLHIYDKSLAAIAALCCAAAKNLQEAAAAAAKRGEPHG